MASLEHNDEVQEQFLTVTQQSNAMIMYVKNQEMEEKRTDESNLSMQAESCIATAELQTAEQMRKEENRSGSAVKIAAKKVLMKQTENEMKISDSSKGDHNNEDNLSIKYLSVAKFDGTIRNENNSPK
ncbi:unnamed protein product [Onchocerca ochengi]|uniref:Ovule protein n=1 Tax=Onchocerca ochengi TaxID=42157 RepID=A0A182EVC2_ONCOC|nr:unnamed protein product [Onchocerca ochengi]